MHKIIEANYGDINNYHEGAKWNDNGYVITHVTNTPDCKAVMIAPVNQRTGKPRKTGELIYYPEHGKLVEFGPRH